MLLAKNPKERYQSASDLIKDLELVAADEPPYFAKRELDLIEVESLTSEIKPDIVRKDPEYEKARKERLTNALMIACAVEFLIIIVLIAFLAN